MRSVLGSLLPSILYLLSSILDSPRSVLSPRYSVLVARRELQWALVPGPLTRRIHKITQSLGDHDGCQVSIRMGHRGHDGSIGNP